MNDRKLLNIGCALLFAVLLASALFPSVEGFVGYAVLILIGAPLLVLAVPHIAGELTLAWELRRAAQPPHPDDVAAWEAQRPRPRAAPPLEARPVWAVVPSDHDAPTAELEGPR